MSSPWIFKNIWMGFRVCARRLCFFIQDIFYMCQGTWFWCEWAKGVWMILLMWMATLKTCRGNWGPNLLPATIKTWTTFFSAFHVSSHEKKTDLSNSVQRHSHLDSKKWKNGCHAKKSKWHFSHLCATLAVQPQCRHPLISVQRLELWIPQTTEIGVVKFRM